MILFLCLLQIGPGLVILTLLIWAWTTLPTGQAILLTALLVPLTYGLIGLFLGPAVLAVLYDLLRSWALLEQPVAAESDPPSPG